MHATRVVAVAMTQGPAAGLAVLDQLRGDARERGMAPAAACRVGMLRRLRRAAEVGDAYRTALTLSPPAAEREFLTRRLAELSVGNPET